MSAINAKLAQLYALRAQVDALIAMDEAEFQAIVAQGPCLHPEEKRQDASTFGDQKFKCLVCGELVKGVA